MKFGKTIETNAKELPEEWQPYLIQYKQLKKNIKQIVQERDNAFKRLNITPPASSNRTEDTESQSKQIDTNERSNMDTGELQSPKLTGGVSEEIDYSIEKDSDGLVRPVIKVKVRKPVCQLQLEEDRIIELPKVAGLPENTSIVLQSSEPMVSTLVDKDGEALASSNDSIAAGCSIGMQTTTDTEETQITVRLEADQLFFDQLVQYIERMQQFEQKYRTAYNSNVSHLSTELATVTSPYKKDYQTWREIFRLYMDAQVWNYSQGDKRSISTAREGQERFGKFSRHIETTGLAQKLRNPVSARLLMSFYKLNLELTHMKLLQEMNEEATRKIIKKHDKRTHLIAKTQFPQLVTIDTTSLTQALMFTIYNDLVGIVPQIDDYLCPMCLNIIWRPLRLDCNHIFCSRCIVKASKRQLFNCPVCRSKGAVYRASVANIDQSLVNFLKLYFPKEIQEKQRDIQRDISEEESQALVAAQEHHVNSNRALPRSRSISSSTINQGERRKYRLPTRYPQPQPEKKPHPLDLATPELINDANNINSPKDTLEAIKVTDSEISQIYDSIMSPKERKIRDEQSLRHRSRAEFLAMRRLAREKARNREFKAEAKSKLPATPAKLDKPEKAKNNEDSNVEKEAKTRSISDKTMERLVYVDTRVVREMEEAKNAVLASLSTSNVDQLQEKVQMAKAAQSSSESPTQSGSSDIIGAEEAMFGKLAPALSVSEFNHVIFGNTLACNVDAAMRTYDLMREAGVKPDQTTYANLTIVHAKSGDLETAVSMFRKLEEEKLEPTVYSYGALIRAYMEFNRVDDAFGVYEMMKKREVWPNLPVYNSLIVSCLKVGDFKRAWGVFEHLRYTIAQPDEVSFSIMIHACAKQGKVEMAMNLFEEMVSSNLVLSDVTFNSLIHACSKRTDYFDECFRLLELMEAHGFQPDFYTYNTIIYACARAKKLALARDIFRDMLKRSMRPDQEDLLKIDSVTIANMMWAYAGYLPGIKNCSWKVAKRYEGIAAKALNDVKQYDGKEPTNSVSLVCSRKEDQANDYLTTSRLLEIQERSQSISRTIEELKGQDVSKEKLDKHIIMLVNVLIPEAVPLAHNQVASEAVRLMCFYIDKLKGEVNSRLLHAYLAALINNGRFESAWRVIFGDYEQFGLPRDGWTYLRAMQICMRTRDVPSAWRVWDHYKKWRCEVEKELNTPGHEKLKPTNTRVYKSQYPMHGDKAALNRVSQEMLSLTTSIEFTGANLLPTNVGGGALAVTREDREAARREIGCDMSTEHAMYMEMVGLLGSCNDFRAAIQLLREQKTDILEHEHKPTMKDVYSLWQNAGLAGDKHALLDIRGLCMEKPLHPARRALHRKWGTSFSWELTTPQYKSLARRFPEEFQKNNPPFKGGEYVYSKVKS
ncbi:hypothetical protein IWW36_000849 [Coemansia brasiliensis]|uniref:Pentatricopeptide repeat-containing protein n=1 Tax=Coemansia brasiliensis TaxID=2650707 RepID=A0A9W8LZJ7_9FUNG|nr:hypothetical protein IWW36_000849 [Coemansia brasiliensis]